MSPATEFPAKPEGVRHGSARLGSAEFERLRALVEARSGVHLSDGKKALVMARLGRRLRELGFTSYEEYIAHLDRHPVSEGVEVVDRLLTNETRLFREAWQFDYLEEEILPAWLRRAENGGRAQVRIWSAACSTGEEPASLAALLAARVPANSSLHVRILATDLSTRALAAARGLSFPLARSEDVPARFARQFERDGGRLRLTARAARLIDFDSVNLLEARTPVGPFDLILCRNVLIYFTRETKRQVIQQLWQALRPGGHLFVGHAESLVGLIDGQRPVRPAIYGKPGESAR